jgi:23S rRNA pseudouridine1911/1915/1917 synthase
MPTHPSHGHTDDTLANAVAYVYQTRGVPFVFRPIGRLDRNTSGISLVAKHAISASYLFYARQNKMIKKRYIALLPGRIDDATEWQTIDTYMKRQEDSIIIRCIGSPDEEDAFRAITHWRVLFTCDAVTLVEAIPETGRTHQLRVHFAHIGHPIIGDDVYDQPSDLISRHALHATSLSIPLPYEGQEKEFLSPPPEDMILAFKRLCGYDLLEIFQKTFHT